MFSYLDFLKENDSNLQNLKILRLSLLEQNKELVKLKGFETFGDFIILYHGTSESIAKKIVKVGYFKEFTWFSEQKDVADRYSKQRR